MGCSVLLDNIKNFIQNIKNLKNETSELINNWISSKFTNVFNFKNFTTFIGINKDVNSYYKKRANDLYSSNDLSENPDNPLRYLFGVDWDKLNIWQKIFGGIALGVASLGYIITIVGVLILPFSRSISAIVISVGILLLIIGSLLASAAFGRDTGTWK